MSTTQTIKMPPVAKLRGIIKKHSSFVILCVLFTVVTTILSCTSFAHQINPDATSYFTIAEKYAHFDIRHAINGYWAPMLSWLLVPAIWMHLEVDITARLIDILASLGILAVVYRFLLHRGASRHVGFITATFLALNFVDWILIGPVTPDLLFSFFVLLFILGCDAFLTKPGTRNGVLVGISGAAMYYTKGFGFYLFIAIIALLFLWQTWQSRKHLMSVIKAYIPVIAIFLVLTLPFIILISIKYGYPTVSNAGAYDHKVFSPAMQGGQPMLTSGPLAPPNPTADTIWEDPSKMIKLMPSWSPLQSSLDLSYFVHQVVENNLGVSLEAMYGFGAAAIAGVLLSIVGCLQKKNRQLYLLFVLVGAIEVIGYSVIYTESRYLWSIALTASIAFGLWLSQLETRRVFNNRQVIVACGILFVILFVPLIGHVQQAKVGSSRSFEQAVAIGEFIPRGSRAIGDNFALYYPCYYLQLHCYSVLETPLPGTGPAYAQLLKNDGIAYYIDFHTRDNDPRLTAFVSIYFRKVGNVNPIPPDGPITIYKLK